MVYPQNFTLHFDTISVLHFSRCFSQLFRKAPLIEMLIQKSYHFGANLVEIQHSAPALHPYVCLLTKTLALRPDVAIPESVPPDQMGFVKNRLAADNVRRLLHVIFFLSQIQCHVLLQYLLMAKRLPID